jgi:uncharacterized protein (TIGR03382 family)
MGAMRGIAIGIFALGCGPVGDADTWPEPVAAHEEAIHGPPHIQYLNFEGGAVTAGNSSDARINSSGIPDEDGVVPPFAGSAADIAAITARVRTAYAPFNVYITTERPPIELEYSMTFIGGTNRIYCPGGCGALGVAPLDCADTNPYDVAFVFSAHLANNDYEGISTTILQESAHAYGLGHTSDARDYMIPFVNYIADRWAQCTGPGVCSDDFDCPYEYGAWPDVCTPEGACCPRVVDSSSCGGEYQDSYATLMSMLGPARAEPFLPEVSFVTPTDRATVGSSFGVDLTATDRTGLDTFDDAGVARIDLVIDQAVVATDEDPPWHFDVADLSTGVHEIEAIAFDDSLNEGGALVTVRVLRDAECSADADCGAGEVCAMGLCGPPATPPEQTPPATRKSSGGCAAAGGGAAASWIALVGLVRRRRR